MMLLAPVLVVVMLFVVHSGRAATVVEQVRHAADQGARAASLVSESRRSAAARAVVAEDLLRHGVGCREPKVEVVTGLVGMTRTVRVSVACGIDGSGLEFLGAAERRVTASSTEAIDVFRGGT